MKKDKAAAPVEETPAERAVLFELETLVAGSRKLLHDILKRALAAKGVELTPVLFSRYCLNASPRQFLPALLATQGKKAEAEGMVQDITDKLAAAVAEAAPATPAGLPLLIRKAQGNGLRVGTLSALSEDGAKALIDKAGLQAFSPALFVQNANDKHFPSADAWLKLAKALNVAPRLCVAITTSAGAAKAALSAGMRCVVIPDSSTGFQDFSGADYVANELNEAAANDIVKTLRLA